MSENKDVKKCKKCGATLVGEKSHKLGLCSNCAREVAQAGGIIAGVFGVFSMAIGIIKSIIRK